MKTKLYIQPTIEVMAVNSAECVCQQAVSKFGDFSNGGGTDQHDPITDGL